MYASLNTRAGIAGLRDLALQEVEAIVHYWFTSSDDPDGVALPGEFHLRYVRRDDVERLLAKGGALRRGTQHDTAQHDTMAP